MNILDLTFLFLEGKLNSQIRNGYVPKFRKRISHIETLHDPNNSNTAIIENRKLKQE